MKTTNPTARDTLYFDGQCPICTREVTKLQELSGDSLFLQNIHEVEEGDLPTRETLLRELHLKTADGDMLVGIDANVAAWQHTRFGVFLRWLRWPLIRSFSSRVYALWAERRYRRLYQASR